MPAHADAGDNGRIIGVDVGGGGDEDCTIFLRDAGEDVVYRDVEARSQGEVTRPVGASVGGAEGGFD